MAEESRKRLCKDTPSRLYTHRLEIKKDNEDGETNELLKSFTWSSASKSKIFHARDCNILLGDRLGNYKICYANILPDGSTGIEKTWDLFEDFETRKSYAPFGAYVEYMHKHVIFLADNNKPMRVYLVTENPLDAGISRFMISTIGLEQMKTCQKCGSYDYSSCSSVRNKIVGCSECN